MSVNRSAIRSAIRAVWDANWSRGTTYRVIWHENSHPVAPTPGEITHWLHLNIEFDRDEMRAFGGGPRANDRAWIGAITARVFAEVGIGDDLVLDLLSDVVTTFRARRSGDLTFVGTIMGVAESPTADGAWFSRGVFVPFQYRFQG